MTNQQYIEEIIKVAVKGEYVIQQPYYARPVVFTKLKHANDFFATFELDDTTVIEDENGEQKTVPVTTSHQTSQLFLDPNFFRAIGKVKWNDENKWRMIGGVAHKIDMKTGKYIPVWIYHALTFYEINFTQDLDHAIEWLYKLIKE